MNRLLLSLLALALAGCIKVDVPEGAFFYPEARLRAENIVLEDSQPWPGAEVLSIAYPGGAVAATRIRTGEVRTPLILFWAAAMSGGGVSPLGGVSTLTPFVGVWRCAYPG